MNKKEYFYDFRDVFDESNKSIFVDNVHFNNIGAKIIAKKLYKIIVENYNLNISN